MSIVGRFNPLKFLAVHPTAFKISAFLTGFGGLSRIKMKDREIKD